MHAHAMNVRASNPRALLAALAHESRYRIALCLLEGDRCVGELAAAIGLSQSCTTRHVQALERAGFVKARRDGKRVLVTIEHAAEGVAELVRWLAPGAASGRPASGHRAGESRRGDSARPAGPRHGERSGASRRGRPADARQAEGQEGPHAAAAPSGIASAPPEAPPPRPPRPHDTIEDFLL
jgi:DNA-binding transcriptional ArsR family regulator